MAKTNKLAHCLYKMQRRAIYLPLETVLPLSFNGMRLAAGCNLDGPIRPLGGLRLGPQHFRFPNSITDLAHHTGAGDKEGIA